MRCRCYRRSVLLIVGLLAVPLPAAEPAPVATIPAANAPAGELFRRDNLVAWCIVPFDAKKRQPEERAAMMARLGFKHFAYDFRAEHIPTFEAEIAACKRHGIALDAWWFPSKLNDDARHILEVCKRTGIAPQLWITGGGTETKSPEEQQQRIVQEATRIRPIAEAAAAQGMKVGLYNHGGWFGEPENQLAIIHHLNLPNVGIVYNWHHGHDHVDRWGKVLGEMLPHLLTVNLNGMNRNGDRQGQKILQLGQGELDLEMLRTLRASGYRGPIGILGHTADDAELRLLDNLDGLDWLVAQLDGKPAGPRPKPRTPVPPAKPAEPKSPDAKTASAKATGYLAQGRDEYRAPSLTVELRATLYGKQGYNILIASDTKASTAHWELFTQPNTGALAAYLPGMSPDHVRSSVNICDGQPHRVAMIYEPTKVALYVDGQLAAEQMMKAKEATLAPMTKSTSGLGLGRLVERGMGCDGTLDYVRLSRGALAVDSLAKDKAPPVDANTLALWAFDQPAAVKLLDRSSHKNHATRSDAAQPAAQPMPPPGVHLSAVDPRLQVALVDRSADEVYMGVKVDSEGQVFVGGREGLFVFEPAADGSYKRRELLRFPKESIIMGLEFRERDLYVVTNNAVYLVPEGRTRRTGLQPQRILWGLPLDLHVSFHCLAWGPDGDLYLTHGDPLLGYNDWNRPDHWGHWTLYCGRDEQPFHYTGQGAVLRMKPDGTDVRVVATGLRGPVGLAFDRRGNLFTNDNDHESRADQYAPARLLHVLPGIDFGWPRGWMASKSPDRYDLIEPMCADLGRGVPCDLAWYDHAHLGDAIGSRLLMCRWDRFAVTAYQPVPRGISCSATEETILQGAENARPTGIAVAPDGRLFVTCLYMTGNMAAPYCASDLFVVTRAEQAAASSPKPAAPADPNPSPTGSSSSPWLQDSYARQLVVTQRTLNNDLEALRESFAASKADGRLYLVLACGHQLTVPPVDYIPPTDLKLFYPAESAFFKRQQYFYGVAKSIDLATRGRVGAYTTAEWWGAITRTEEQEALFKLLLRATDDSDDRVRLQAAYYLSLLKDPRSEPKIERTRTAVVIGRLSAATPVAVERVWRVGPFDDTERIKPHAPEQGPLDLTARYETAQGVRAWQELNLSQLIDPPAKDNETQSTYLHFNIASGARQPALLTLAAASVARVWQNGVELSDSDRGELNVSRRWLLDLQPGSNDLLVRLSTGAASNRSTIAPALVVAALSKVAITLPEKLDGALLAERLRSAAATGSGSQAIAAEFLAVDWTEAAKTGDAAEGRRLFGVLACNKCHAVVADQKGGGAPSLFEARRRFNVPHLVESIILPSRQVAEPFRAQTITTSQGQTFTGIVVAESGDRVEIVLPDAQRRTIPKSQIDDRAVTTLSPMPQGLVKTTTELQHLLEIIAHLLGDRQHHRFVIGELVLLNEALLARLRQFFLSAANRVDHLIGDRDRRQIGFREITIIVRLFFRSHRANSAGLAVKQARLLKDYATAVVNRLLLFDFSQNGLLNIAE